MTKKCEAFWAYSNCILELKFNLAELSIVNIKNKIINVKNFQPKS